MREGISGLHYEILDLVIAEDEVMAYVRMTGVQTGELFGLPASGRSIDVRQMQIEWIRDGRICQHWRLTDDLTFLRQIGHIK